VVIQLSGANDCLNTVVPYSNGLYYDFRPNVHLARLSYRSSGLLLEI
jgi:uncharacterized protein (DUF1501 family)